MEVSGRFLIPFKRAKSAFEEEDRLSIILSSRIDSFPNSHSDVCLMPSFIQ